MNHSNRQWDREQAAPAVGLVDGAADQTARDARMALLAGQMVHRVVQKDALPARDRELYRETENHEAAVSISIRWLDSTISQKHSAAGCSPYPR